MGERGEIVRGGTSTRYRSPAPNALGELCWGQDPTIAGTDGNDVLVGTDGPDIIAAGNGNDRIYGLDGDDRICDDAEAFAEGNDIIYAGKGDDLIGDLVGKDTVYGGPGADDIGGGDDSDLIYGQDTTTSRAIQTGISSPEAGQRQLYWQPRRRLGVSQRGPAAPLRSANVSRKDLPMTLCPCEG